MTRALSQDLRTMEKDNYLVIYPAIHCIGDGRETIKYFLPSSATVDLSQTVFCHNGDNSFQQYIEEYVIRDSDGATFYATQQYTLLVNIFDNEVLTVTVNVHPYKGTYPGLYTDISTYYYSITDHITGAEHVINSRLERV